VTVAELIGFGYVRGVVHAPGDEAIVECSERRLRTDAATALRPVAARPKYAQRLDPDVASLVKKALGMNRLDNIATRQRKSRVRDVMFALLVVVAGAVSLSSVSTAAHAAQVVRR